MYCSDDCLRPGIPFYPIDQVAAKKKEESGENTFVKNSATVKIKANTIAVNIKKLFFVLLFISSQFFELC